MFLCTLNTKIVMKIVLAAGTFDVVHEGHKFFLQEAKKFGDKLIVIIARDETVEKVKGKRPKYSEEVRKQHVEQCNIADEVRLGNKGGIFAILEDIKPDIICLGYDQGVKEETLREELQKRNLKAKIERLPPYKPEIYKSSKIK